MNLSSERLIMRDYRPDDWERIHIYGSDPDFSKYEIWGPNTIQDTHNFVADMIQQAQVVPAYKYNFAVCLKESDLLIGGVSMRRETEESRVANLGWAINPEFQNKGYATEAAQTLVNFGFKDLDLSVIYATCDTRNIASYRVMEKLGMKRVGFIKGTKEIKGYVRDSWRYELYNLK